MAVRLFPFFFSCFELVALWRQMVVTLWPSLWIFIKFTVTTEAMRRRRALTCAASLLQKESDDVRGKAAVWLHPDEVLRLLCSANSSFTFVPAQRQSIWKDGCGIEVVEGNLGWNQIRYLPQTLRYTNNCKFYFKDHLHSEFIGALASGNQPTHWMSCKKPQVINQSLMK